jgi:ketosteroid isomerase-like protein
VIKLRGCLGALGKRQQRFLTLRAGLGRGQAMSRAAAARDAGVPKSAARRYERRALRTLRRAARSGVCGGQSRAASSGRTPRSIPSAYTGQARASSASEPAPARGPGGGGSDGKRRQEVAGATAEGPSPDGDDPPPSARRTGIALPVVTGLADADQGSFILALAVLAALVTWFLTRRPDEATVTATAAPAAPAPINLPVPYAAPLALEAEAVVRQALTALSTGDVEAAAEVVHRDVIWAVGSLHPPLHGRDEFRDYWTQRLSVVQAEFVPGTVEFRRDSVSVEIQEIARDLHGEGGYGELRTRYRFRFRDGLIAEVTRGV